jgi:hypothetical protein
MRNTRTFTGVTPAVVSLMKEIGLTKYGIVYDPPDGPAGTATSQTPLGDCVVEFQHDRATAELKLTLVRKPWLLPEGLLWDGFVTMLQQCRGQY